MTASQELPAGAETTADLQRIRRTCAAIRAGMPQVMWDLAVIEVTARRAVDQGCTRTDTDTLSGRFPDLDNGLDAVAEQVAALGAAITRLRAAARG